MRQFSIIFATTLADAYFWQPGGGHDRIVIAELGEKIRYCHRNPSVSRALRNEHRLALVERSGI